MPALKGIAKKIESHPASPASLDKTLPSNKAKDGSGFKEGTRMHIRMLQAFFFGAFSTVCMAQTWELGAVGGYGWYHDPTITNLTQSGQAGFAPRAALGVVFGENPYSYIGGELRWLFRFGGPELRSNGIVQSTPGYTNAITYDFLFHATRKESAVRPFVAAGAGIKAYTNSFQEINQPLATLAVLRPITQVEPAISVGAGVKYALPKHIQLRVDFRMLVTPLPDDLIRRTDPATRLHGWLYDFLPLLEVGYSW